MAVARKRVTPPTSLSVAHFLAHLLISFHPNLICSSHYTINTAIRQNPTMSQPRRSTRKKRQTQLTFTPLPSSSPAASQYPEKVRQRAASVRYDDAMSSPTKKRRVGGSPPVGSRFSRASSNAGSPFGSQKVQVVIPSPSRSSDQLPTPAASSQVEMDNEPGNYTLDYALYRLLRLIYLSKCRITEEKPTVWQSFQAERSQ